MERVQDSLTQHRLKHQVTEYTVCYDVHLENQDDISELWERHKEAMSKDFIL